MLATDHLHRERTVRQTALTLSAANMVVLGAGWWIGSPLSVHRPSLVLLLGFTTAFALVGAIPMRLDFGEHQVTFTLTDSVLVTALFYLAAPWLGIVATVGELAIGLVRRTPPLKALFNAASRAGAATAAAAAFAALGGRHGVGPGTWVPALVAAACWGFLNIATVAAVLARAEARRFEEILSRSIPTALGTSLLGASSGLVVVELLHLGPLYPLLALPIALGVTLNNRHAATQRDEHLRIERLYEATARTAQIGPGLAVVGAVADEARRLLTGAAALCCVREADGEWVGSTSRPEGTATTPADDIREVVWWAGQATAEAESVAVPPGLRHLAPDTEALVTARSPAGSPVEVLLVVLRRAPTAGGARGLRDTLSAFAAHAAVMTANARLLQEVQRSLEAQVAANQRKDEFVATISHELRTPLTVMLGAAQTLLRLDAKLEPADRIRFLQAAVDQGGRLEHLIDDLLSVAAAEQGAHVCELATIDPRELAEDIRADVPSEFRDRVGVHLTGPPVPFTSDRHRVRQIVANLSDNARKYAPGSPVEVDIGAGDIAVSIAVVDHGPGIPEADRDRVFDRFVQLDQSSTRRQGGTGLGLFLCRQLATQLGGALEFAPTPGGGCTFTLTVPRRAPGADVPGADAPGATVEAAVRPTALRRRPKLVGAPSTNP